MTHRNIRGGCLWIRCDLRSDHWICTINCRCGWGSSSGLIKMCLNEQWRLLICISNLRKSDSIHLPGSCRHWGLRGRKSWCRFFWIQNSINRKQFSASLWSGVWVVCLDMWIFIFFRLYNCSCCRSSLRFIRERCIFGNFIKGSWYPELLRIIGWISPTDLFY